MNTHRCDLIDLKQLWNEITVNIRQLWTPIINIHMYDWPWVLSYSKYAKTTVELLN